MDEKIIEALEKIKEICEEQGTDCDSCPFANARG